MFYNIFTGGDHSQSHSLSFTKQKKSKYNPLKTASSSIVCTQTAANNQRYCPTCGRSGICLFFLNTTFKFK